jgi:cytochrome c5
MRQSLACLLYASIFCLSWASCQAQDQRAGVKERIASVKKSDPGEEDLNPAEPSEKEPEEVEGTDPGDPSFTTPQEPEPAEPENDEAALRLQGEQIYADLCQGCHGPIVSSVPSGKGEQEIVDAGGMDQHQQVTFTWPSAGDAKALEVALSE